jgi:hypothetical protein
MPETVTEGAVSQDRPILVEADYLVVGAGAPQVWLSSIR